MGLRTGRKWGTAAVAAVMAVLVAVPAVAQRAGWVGTGGQRAQLAIDHDHAAADVDDANEMDHHAHRARIERIAAANGLKPANGTGPCKDWFAFTTPNGVHCSKGPMLRSMFTEEQLEGSGGPGASEVKAAQAAVADGSTTSATDPKVTCIGSGSDGKRLQLVYARRSNKADRYAATATDMKNWAAQIEEIFVLSAQKTGGVRKPRWVTDSNCVATVLNITVGTSVSTFSQLTAALEGAGLTSASRKYMVAWDDGDGTGAFCGLGESMPDSSAGSSNKNETQVLGAMFAAVEPSCWTAPIAGHEIMHTLGAVQADAPHATDYGHCTDESDLMCYVDGPGTVLTQVCPAAQESLYDCNNDDYFSTNPPAGNYLKTHWNPANSGWLDATGSVGPPTSPRDLGIQVVGSGSVKVTWTAPAFDGGSAVQAYVVTITPGGRSLVVAAPATQLTVTGLADGVGVSASVAAMNAKGVGAADVTAEVIPSPPVNSIATSPDDEPYQAMTRGPSGSVYVAAGDEILRVEPNGTKTRVVGGAGSGENTNALETEVHPGPLAVAPNGDLYFYDSWLGTIRRLNGGKVNTVAGNGSFSNSGDGGAATSAGVVPTAMAVNPVDSSVLVAESSTHVVRRFTVGGTITRVAGTTNTSGFQGDGAAATSARFNQPRDVAIDSSGNVYVADGNNQRIRKFTVAGNISTVAGDGTNLIELSPEVDATTGVPFPRAIDWSSERGLLIDSFGLVRRLTGTKLKTFAGVIFDDAASDADGTPAGEINYTKSDNVAEIVYSTNVFHVLATGTNPATSSFRARVRSAGPWSAAAAATAPAAPVKAPTATAGQESATVNWLPPSNGGSDITSYEIVATPGGATATAGAAATSATIRGLTAGTSYTFTVAAVNAVGKGTPSTASNAVTPTAVPPKPGYSPFASWSALVARVYSDLVNRAPTSSESSSWVSQLTSAAKTKGDLADSLRRGSENLANVDPVVRIYRAFLGRSPDAGGLKFWIKRKRAVAPNRTWTVTQIATEFTKSNEFVTKYGGLTNKQWVTQIYTDVLGRAADSAGVTFWTKQLDTGRKTKAQVMVGFSESNEYKTKQAQNTDVSVAYVYLMGRSPSSAEATDWVTRQKAGTTHAALLTELLSSDAYAAHIG